MLTAEILQFKCKPLHAKPNPGTLTGKIRYLLAGGEMGIREIMQALSNYDKGVVRARLHSLQGHNGYAKSIGYKPTGKYYLLPPVQAKALSIRDEILLMLFKGPKKRVEITRALDGVNHSSIDRQIKNLLGNNTSQALIEEIDKNEYKLIKMSKENESTLHRRSEEKERTARESNKKLA